MKAEDGALCDWPRLATAAIATKPMFLFNLSMPMNRAVTPPGMRLLKSRERMTSQRVWAAYVLRSGC